MIWLPSAVDRCLSLFYDNILRVRVDIKDVVRVHQTLIIRTGRLTLSQATSKLLVQLCGTIPVVYKDYEHNIPIRLWLLDTYPVTAPLCYVDPKENMKIIVSEYCNEMGQIQLPYLRAWNRHTSNLLELIEVMRSIFGDIPPLATVRIMSDPSATPSQIMFADGASRLRQPRRTEAEEATDDLQYLRQQLAVVGTQCEQTEQHLGLLRRRRDHLKELIARLSVAPDSGT